MQKTFFHSLSKHYFFFLSLFSLIVASISFYLKQAEPVYKSDSSSWAQKVKGTEKNFVVLLTMTIDTKNTITVQSQPIKRKNISDRINDYRKSLARWAELPYTVIAVENSGYGNPFEDILKNAPNIHYVSTYIPSDPERGKGYGEGKTLAYAINHLIPSYSTYIMKVTGRYAPKYDLSKVIEILKTKKPEVLLKIEPDDPNPYMKKRSEWFVAKKLFYEQLTKSCFQTCDDRDSPNRFMETHLHNLGDKTKKVVKTNLKIPVVLTKNGVDISVVNI